MKDDPPRTAEELIALYRALHPKFIEDTAYVRPVCMAEELRKHGD